MFANFGKAMYPDSSALPVVIAGSDIPKGTTVGPLRGKLPVGQFKSEDMDEGHHIKVYFANGTLTPSTATERTWTHSIQTARDRHEQNAEVYRTPEETVFIRTVRNISEGEFLYLWYEDSFALENNIPFLTLDNIKGSRAYECTACGEVFQSPNPLKVHIRFTCHTHETRQNREPRTTYRTDDLIDKFKKEPLTNASPDRFTSHQPQTSFRRYIAEPNHECKRVTSHGSPCPLYSNTGTSCPQFEAITRRPLKHHGQYLCPGTAGPATGYQSSYIVPDRTRPSFSPMESRYDCHVTCGVTSGSCRSPYKLKASISVSPELNCSMSFEPSHCNYPSDCGWKGEDSSCFRRDEQSLSTFPMPSHADGEPLDIIRQSFMAMSSTKGHLCIYCGKFYSRKYGLKIHLRTHTGYKPLKCKVCFRAFGDPSNLNKHIRLHAEGDTPYKCEYCGKILVRRRDLKRHIKSRHPNEDEADDDEGDQSDEIDCG